MTKLLMVTVSSLTAEKMLVDMARALTSLPRDLDKVCRGLVSTQLHPHQCQQCSA